MYNVHPPMISLTHINSVSTPAVDFNVIVGKFWPCFRQQMRERV